MAGGPYYPRTAGSLKAASCDLVGHAGGAREAARLSGRVSESMIRQYTGETDTELHIYMPVDIAHRLEVASGAYDVTRWLAQASGHALIALDREKARGESYPAFLAKAAREAGELFGCVGDALASGHVDARERAEIRREASELMTVLSGLIARIDAENRRD